MRRPATSVLLCLAGIIALGLTIRVGSKNKGNATESVASRVPGQVGSRPTGVPARPSEIPKRERSASVVHEYSQLPMAFEPNVGQSNGQAKFLARGNGYALFLTPGEAVLVLRSPRTATKVTDSATERRTASLLRGVRPPAIVRMKLVGTNSAPVLAALDELPGKSNYLIGNQPANWHVNVPNYRKVAERGVYTGIDLVYYGTQRQLEYDFIVEPGADPRVIQLAIDGPKKLRIDAQGELVASIEGWGSTSEKAVRLPRS